MSEQPFFPSPSVRAAKAAEPYRAPGTVPAPATQPSTRRDSSRPSADVSLRAQVIEQIVAEKAKQRRSAAIALVLGLAISVGGVVLSLLSRGQMIFYGLVIAGVLAILRGTMSLAKSAMGA